MVWWVESSRSARICSGFEDEYLPCDLVLFSLRETIIFQSIVGRHETVARGMRSGQSRHDISNAVAQLLYTAALLFDLMERARISSNG